jgi:hypothetical protein
MAWNKLIPAATDQINVSQGDIQANFMALDPLFNGVTNFAAIFTTLGATPTTGASQLSVFAADDSSSNPQLFIGPPSTGTPINITGSGQATNGWARLPSNVLIKWGTTTAAVNTLGTITFPVSASVPVFGSIFYVSACQTFAAGPTTSTLNASVSAGNFTTTTFQVWPNTTTAPLVGTISITYLAIGI